MTGRQGSYFQSEKCARWPATGPLRGPRADFAKAPAAYKKSRLAHAADRRGRRALNAASFEVYFWRTHD